MAMANILLVSSAVLVISFMTSIILLFFNQPTFYHSDTNLTSEQHEIVFGENYNTTEVLTKEGKLSERGWAKDYEKFDFSKKYIKPTSSVLSLLNRFRYKKFESFIITHSDFVIGFSLFDISYLGGYMVHWADLRNTSHAKFTYQHLNPFKSIKIEDNINKKDNHDNLIAQLKTTLFDYNQTNYFNKNKHITLKFNHSELTLVLDLKLEAKDLDSMVGLTPISQDSTSFYYNVKTYNIKAKGKFRINNQTISDKELLVTYDSGRGVWPVKSGWVWASASGNTTEGDNIGLNFGYGFSNPNSTRHSEDSFFVNGKIYKLNNIDTSLLEEGNKWTFTSIVKDEINNSCNVTFTKLETNVNDLNLIFARSKFNIYYGKFGGVCRDYTEKEYTFNLNGFIEDKMSIW